jgi:hypothetical protein
MEIVVIDLAVDPAPMRELDHPSVRRFHRPDIETFGAARAECVRQSRGPIVAFLEDHCYADRRWAEEIAAAFDDDVAIINYAMTSANPESLLGRMFLMCEYGRWMDPAISGDLPISASHNVAYRRIALEPYLDRLNRLCQAEFLMHREMQAAGARVRLAAKAKLAHVNWTQLGEGVQANRLLKRLFAAERVTQGHLNALTRIGWAGGMALTPALHVARTARSLIRRPTLWPLFLASLPLMTLMSVSCAWSEATGYLFGEGDCSARFRDLEISIERKT